MNFLTKHTLLASGLILTLFTTTGAQAALANAGDYAIDPNHSNIGFEVSHMGASLVVGRFNKFQGTISYAPKGVSKVHVEIDASSIDTNQGQRDDHLRSEDFFSVEQFPKAVFDSDSVEYNEDGSPKLIKGKLTMHGQTQEVLVNVTSIGTATGKQNDFHAGFVGKALIKRSEFGMKGLLATVGDEVALTLNVEAVQK